MVNEAESPPDSPSPREIVVQRIFVVQIGIIAAIAVLCLLAYLSEYLADKHHWESYTLGFNWPLFLVGCMGASIALLHRIQKGQVTLTERSARAWTTTLMPLLYGGVMAAVTYVLFMSGVLSGDDGGGLLTTNLFPTFANPAGDGGSIAFLWPVNQPGVSVTEFMMVRPATVRDLGKLFVWSFLAGYSEGFVVGILGQLERAGTREPTPDQPSSEQESEQN